MTFEWTLWERAAPLDVRKVYKWRIPASKICGKVLRPEWSGKMSFCGVGYRDSEWWPPFSYWNGYTRSVPKGTEWRGLKEDEDADEIFWGGFNFLPCPFTGKSPKIIYMPMYIGAPPYNAEWLGIESYLVRSNGWIDANALEKAWNTRFGD